MYELSNQKSGRSQLIFVASNRSTESIGFHDLKRAREPVSRSKRGVQGKVADTIHNRSRHAESQNELKAFQVLLATGRADHWQEQPFVLKYHQSGAKHRYPALHRLEYKGWIKSDWGNSENNRRAKFYRLTAAGRRQLETELATWDRLSSAIMLVLGRAVEAS